MPFSWKKSIGRSEALPATMISFKFPDIITNTLIGSYEYAYIENVDVVAG